MSFLYSLDNDLTVFISRISAGVVPNPNIDVNVLIPTTFVLNWIFCQLYTFSLLKWDLVFHFPTKVVLVPNLNIVLKDFYAEVEWKIKLQIFQTLSYC